MRRAWRDGRKMRYGGWPTISTRDRKSTRLNSSHSQISYAVFCLKKKKTVTHTSHLHSCFPHETATPYTIDKATALHASLASGVVNALTMRPTPPAPSRAAPCIHS